jgi:hypothetical protein
MKKFPSPYLVVALFIILVVVMTYPLVFNITTYMPGFFSSDESFAVIWNAWMTKYSSLHHLSIKKTDFIAYPFGVDFFTNQPFALLWFSVNYLLAIFTTPALTYNIQVLSNLFLAAFFMFLLVRRITHDDYSAFFSGVIFGFCPYIFVRSWQHLGETYIWAIPMVLFSLFRLRDKNTVSVNIAIVISFVIASLNLFILVYILVIVALLLCYLFIRWNENKIFIRRILFISLFVFLALLPQMYPVIRQMFILKATPPSVFNPYHRPFEDLFAQSARPLSYILPTAMHPLFGPFTRKFVGTKLYGASFTEHTLYLGWVPMLLAFLAFRARRRMHKEKKGTDSVYSNIERSDILFFSLVAFLAWLISQPPWWNFGPLKIFMPSYLGYKILPMFRAYCRFGVVVMMAIAVLAGFGLKGFLAGRKRAGSKFAIASIFSCLVLFEFWNYPPYKVIDIAKAPDVYSWVKAQPDNTVIAEYPLDARSPNDLYKLYQITHEKKMINGSVNTSTGRLAHEVAQELVILSDLKTVQKLRWLGVRYVLVHHEGYLETEIIRDRKELESISHNSGLRLVRSFPGQDCPRKDIMCIQKCGPIDVYEVIAEPLKPKAISN